MPPTRYAADTSVPPDRSRAQIEHELHKHGAQAFAYATEGSKAMIGFKILNEAGNVIQVRMTLPLPDPGSDEFHKTPTGKRRDAATARSEWEKACRASWRGLHLVVKAKLLAVAQGISTIEREFMADVLTPSGKTIGELVGEQRKAIESGGGLRLLPGRGS